MNKQITHIRIANGEFTGGNVSNTEYELSIQDYTVNVDPAFYESATTESINGFLRSNLRGFRPRVVINYNESLQSDLFRNLFDDITASDKQLTFAPDANSPSNTFTVVPESLRYKHQFSNTVGVFIPSITLISQTILTAIPSYL